MPGTRKTILFVRPEVAVRHAFPSGTRAAMCLPCHRRLWLGRSIAVPCTDPACAEQSPAAAGRRQGGCPPGTGAAGCSSPAPSGRRQLAWRSARRRVRMSVWFLGFRDGWLRGFPAFPFGHLKFSGFGVRIALRSVACLSRRPFTDGAATHRGASDRIEREGRGGEIRDIERRDAPSDWRDLRVFVSGLRFGVFAPRFLTREYLKRYAGGSGHSTDGPMHVGLLACGR